MERACAPICRLIGPRTIARAWQLGCEPRSPMPLRRMYLLGTYEHR
jgi:hypothetical protein